MRSPDASPAPTKTFSPFMARGEDSQGVRVQFGDAIHDVMAAPEAGRRIVGAYPHGTPAAGARRHQVFETVVGEDQVRLFRMAREHVRFDFLVRGPVGFPFPGHEVDIENPEDAGDPGARLTVSLVARPVPP